jgi:platelet-activating factor acetylhydrolase IB subunit alpha
VNGDGSEFGYLVSGSRDKTVQLWDAFSGQCLMTFAAHDSWVREVILHPSGKFILSCSDDKTIRVFDIKEGRCIRTINDAHTHFITCLGFSAKHAVLISGSVDKNIAVWSCN